MTLQLDVRDVKEAVKRYLEDKGWKVLDMKVSISCIEDDHDVLVTCEVEEIEHKHQGSNLHQIGFLEKKILRITRIVEGINERHKGRK